MTFTAETYQQRRRALIQNMDSGLVFLLGNDNVGMSYRDNHYPYFRQDSTFLYYIGIDLPELSAIIDIDSGQTTVYGNDVTVDSMVWTGPQPSLDTLIRERGIQAHASPDKLSETLAKAKSQGRNIHFLPPYRGDHDLAYMRLLGLDQESVAQAASRSLIQAIVKQRSYKTEVELGELAKAVQLTNRMHLTAMRVARPGMTEAEVMAKVHAEALGADSYVSFPIIMTVHGEILHNHHHHNKLTEDRLLLVDCGGESPLHYCGDMTRTFPVASSFTTRHKEVYEVALDAQLAAIDALKPGVLYKDVHLLAATRIVEGLKALGIMKGDVQEAVAAGAHAMFFPHGLGHMMGLDVHDMENLGEDYVGYTDIIQRNPQFGLKSLRLGRALEAGFVITVEPGIYFIPGLIDQWGAAGKCKEFIDYNVLEGYRDFGGIRIEDDYVITPDGARLLGAPVPKTVTDVHDMENLGEDYVGYTDIIQRNPQFG
ncbi:MAG: aminopeptidase P family protein, partial [Bacteroidota bacterium]